jgi:hypothetical protein
LFAIARGNDVQAEEKDSWKMAGKNSKSDIFQIWTDGKNLPTQNFDIQPLQTSRSLQELLSGCTNPWDTSLQERQTMKSHWEKQVNDSRWDEFQSCMKKFTDQNGYLRTQYREFDRRCLVKAHVIGVTTTGLAANSRLLRSLGSKVLICEEAAEVLEAHLITALLPTIEHAILIGDHEQLRPHISKHELSMECDKPEKFGLDESLFERLVKEKFKGAKMPIAKLYTQRRMHPSIAALVKDTLYPELENDPRTNRFPEVAGMRKRLFWLDHQNHENAGGLMEISKSNEYEAKMVLSLVRHLSQQGIYTGKDDIAILTPYLGQRKKLCMMLGDEFNIIDENQELEDAKLDKDVQKQLVRIATVDSFQVRSLSSTY